MSSYIRSPWYILNTTTQSMSAYPEYPLQGRLLRSPVVSKQCLVGRHHHWRGAGGRGGGVEGAQGTQAGQMCARWVEGNSTAFNACAFRFSVQHGRRCGCVGNGGWGVEVLGHI